MCARVETLPLTSKGPVLAGYIVRLPHQKACEYASCKNLGREPQCVPALNWRGHNLGEFVQYDHAEIITPAAGLNDPATC